MKPKENTKRMMYKADTTICVGFFYNRIFKRNLVQYLWSQFRQL